MKQIALIVVFGLFSVVAMAADVPRGWKAEWPRTDFAKTSVQFDEIMGGGPPKDGIPSIDNPRFQPVDEARWLDGRSPVIGIEINGDARAYPLGILNRHEIANDRVGGVPVAVTFCPLCNASVVFRREIGGSETTFGTTGKLRNSDLVMYDRRTESWWQQFTGKAIVGELTGYELERIPARIESFDKFRQRHPNGRVLERPFSRHDAYETTPYPGYDGNSRPWGFYRGPMPKTVSPMARVVTVADRAWALKLVRDQGRVETEDGLIITWSPGQASALDQPVIAESRDVGNVVVQRRTEDGLEDVPYGVDFAFAWKAFNPDREPVARLEE